LQDNIIAYHDQAWGDVDILLDYRCTPGMAVDRYRLGYKTYVLISRREVKSKGDVETFHSEPMIRAGGPLGRASSCLVEKEAPTPLVWVCLPLISSKAATTARISPTQSHIPSRPSTVNQTLASIDHSPLPVNV
jgi:hypothetical protein